METASISYRVADFLKQYPPFQAMEEADLLDLAGRGRVKFFEANEYIAVQGDPYMLQLFVIQQGTVTLWNEEGEVAQLCDVRGAGDFLGIEQFNGLDAYSYSAKSASDVVVYLFPAIEFESLVLKYPYAKRYVAAYGGVSADYKPGEEHRDPKDVFIHDLVAGRQLRICDARSSIRQAAHDMLVTGAEAMAVLDSDQRSHAVLTPGSFLEWIANGAKDPDGPITSLVSRSELPAIASDASVADATLAMAMSEAGVLAMTEDGTAGARLQALITPRYLLPVFGDQPVAILREIRGATTVQALRDLNHRARAFVMRHLTSAGSVEWLARFASLADAGIVKRLISINDAENLRDCWCFCGPAGRGETLTRVAPELVMILEDEHDAAAGLDAYQRISAALNDCGYIPAAGVPFEPSFYVAGLGEWKGRFHGWITDPILQNMYQARSMFDLRPIHGNSSLWNELNDAVRATVNKDFLFLLANDCLESLPPLTFFQDAVISGSGEESIVFRLEYSALGPLVDVGRVFGIASGKILGSSTLERFVMARSLLPDQAPIFQEASDALRVVLWQQGRVGINQNSDGSELPPSLLSRYDRQILKRGFRSILRLLEFTGNSQWLTTI